MSMLYNINNKKILFIHIPKTGGSSIGTILKSYEINAPNIVGHQGYKECIRHYKPDHIFTIVRNPWDWRASWYYYLKQDMAGHRFEYDKVTRMSFKNHLIWLENEHKENFTNSVYDGITSKVFIKSQSEYVEGGNISILRFENLKEDFESYMLELGLNIKFDVHINKSNNNNYRSEYDDESIGIVSRLWGEDINKFGYEY